MDLLNHHGAEQAPRLAARHAALKDNAPRPASSGGVEGAKTKKDESLHSRSTTTAAQRARLLALLRIAPRTTHELRAHGVSHPAGRVHDLQKCGFRIDSSRVTTVDSDGYVHAGVARYQLLESPPTPSDSADASGGAYAAEAAA